MKDLNTAQLVFTALKILFFISGIKMRGESEEQRMMPLL
jgi:hypothetical protein